MIRLEKYLVNCGVNSRKNIKRDIASGNVLVNGIVELNDATEVDENDEILYFNEKVEKKVLCYYMMHKPAGYITAVANPVNEKAILWDLLPESIDKRGLAPVGRLDKDTEGLIILTNDGDLNFTLTHPDKDIFKTYLVTCDRSLSDDDLVLLQNGVKFDEHISKPAKVERISHNEIYLSITEGKYHQVKKMIKGVGNKVIYLKRVTFGKLSLGDLPIGEILEISKSDII